MHRAAISEADRPGFHLHVGVFQDFATDAFSSALSGAQKRGLTPTCAHVFVAQLTPQIADAVFGNVADIFASRVSGEDAARLAREITDFHPQIFRELETGEICVPCCKDHTVRCPAWAQRVLTWRATTPR